MNKYNISFFFISVNLSATVCRSSSAWKEGLARACRDTKCLSVDKHTDQSRPKTKTDGSKSLKYTGLCGDLEHLTIETRLTSESFECVIMCIWSRTYMCSREISFFLVVVTVVFSRAFISLREPLFFMKFSWHFHENLTFHFISFHLLGGKWVIQSFHFIFISRLSWNGDPNFHFFNFISVVKWN